MNSIPESSLWLTLFWSSDPLTQRAIGVVLAGALAAFAFVHLPLLLRLLRLSRLERRLRGAAAETRGDADLRHEIATAFADSPAARQWERFSTRWKRAQAEALPERAPVRLIEVLEEDPLLPSGPRRTLLPALPGLFLALGLLGSFVGLALAATGASDAALAADERARLVAGQLGLALHATLWGLGFAMLASLAGRLIEGGFEALAETLDAWTERGFGNVSSAELSELAFRSQATHFDSLARELTRFSGDLAERLDRGLQRIERSMSQAAGLVSEEQRQALHGVVGELSLTIRQGVDQHLSELRGSLQRATEHQNSVSNALTQTFERMAENAQVNDRVIRNLDIAARSVQEAATSMHGSAESMVPILSHLRETGRSLETTSDTIGETQIVLARTAEAVRAALEHAAGGVEDQRQFLDLSLGEIRATIDQLGQGLGENLQTALRNVDDVLSHTVGRLRETLVESNETIDRLAQPVRAAEGTTREMQAALERLRGEVEALGSWLAQAVKPLRQSLHQLEEHTGEMTRSMSDFGAQARQMDKTMEALRGELREEGRHGRTAQSELGRRLQQTNDALALLERAMLAVTREQRRESTEKARRGAEAGSDLLEPGYLLPASARRAPDPGIGRHSVPREDADRHVSDPVPTSAAAASEPEVPLSRATSGAAGEERPPLSRSYRFGTPRAIGPDPYAREEARAARERAAAGRNGGADDALDFDDDLDEPRPHAAGTPITGPDDAEGDAVSLSGLLGRRRDTSQDPIPQVPFSESETSPGQAAAEDDDDDPSASGSRS